MKFIVIFNNPLFKETIKLYRFTYFLLRIFSFSGIFNSFSLKKYYFGLVKKYILANL